MVAKRLHDFLVGKFQQLGSFFYQGDTDPEGGEHTRVLDADDASAHHNQRLGQSGDIENLIAVDDRTPIDGNPGRVGRLGARGDDDVLRLVRLSAALVGDLYMGSVFEACNAWQNID